MTAAVDRANEAPTTTAPRLAAKVDIGKLLTHLALLFLVVLWTFPTAGLLISSLRDKDQLAVSGWWTALSTSTSLGVTRIGTDKDQVEEGGKFVIRGNVFGTSTNKHLDGFGLSNAEPASAAPGTGLPMKEGGTITVQDDGAFEWVSDTRFTHTRGPRIFYVSGITPRFTLDNYVEVLTANGVGRSFINSFTVTIQASA
ncbi:MAG: hypothetical protein EOP19_16725 [Hyphomicrobiales bacterium]|nr:MAG: hypothetical protein EOP19_16725 [Hyphomicrobiales bacterium]